MDSDEQDNFSGDEMGEEDLMDMDIDSDYDDVDYYNDDDEDYSGFDLGRSQEISRQKSFEVLPESVLREQSNAILEEVMDMLALPSQSAATILLRHYKWNKEKLIADYISGDPEKIRKEAGVVSGVLESPVKPEERTKPFECLICLEDYVMDETYALGCGHRYCKTCWQQYLELKVTTEANSVNTKCPFPTCKEVVHEQAFHKLMGAEKAIQLYDQFALRSLVEDNLFLKFCPAPNCSNIVKVERKNRRESVTCACGFSFCFRCNDYEIGDHMPATCANVDAWMEKAGDESENVKWLIANTKRCPECRKPIEKNGGCMHLTCAKASGGCGHEFCWLCRGPWAEHGSETGGYYACNKYDASNAKQEDLRADQVKTELEHYMFYYHRYESHGDAMKIAGQQRQQTQLKAEEVMSIFKVRAQDTKFLEEATEQLLKNRRVLRWSYVYGFYLSNSSKDRSLFEYLQEDLEKHTEGLSKKYEMPLSQIENYNAFIKYKEEVTNYTRVTAGFLKKFVEGVMGGLTDV